MPRVEIRKSRISLIALFVTSIALWYLVTGQHPISFIMGSTAKGLYKFEAVGGFFEQDDPKTDAKQFEYAKQNFGLIDREYDTDQPGDEKLTQWERFEKYMDSLVKSSPDGTTYKVIYLGRHGEGFHNVAEAKYGTKTWDDYWSKLDGDGELFWDDAHLTEKGKYQALDNNAFLKQQFAEAKMPAPAKYYSSPLYRCLQTAYLTYSGIELPVDRPFKPLIKELMREVMGEHTCDRRSSKTVIHGAFPDADIETTFAENDELWQVDHRETFAEHDARTQQLLDDVFGHDDHTFISFTSHSGAIASLLRVIGHCQYFIPTGAMMPVLIKATRSS